MGSTRASPAAAPEEPDALEHAHRKTERAASHTPTFSSSTQQPLGTRTSHARARRPRALCTDHFRSKCSKCSKCTDRFRSKCSKCIRLTCGVITPTYRRKRLLNALQVLQVHRVHTSGSRVMTTETAAPPRAAGAARKCIQHRHKPHCAWYIHDYILSARRSPARQ
eukprot:2723016-Prymnesium_polylepis.1